MNSIVAYMLKHVFVIPPMQTLHCIMNSILSLWFPFSLECFASRFTLPIISKTINIFFSLSEIYCSVIALMHVHKSDCIII